MTKLELLAPAKNLETGIAAINSGADAVYIGASHHGARAGASNSINDIRELCSYAHKFRVRVYVTVNTLVYDEEIEEVRSLVSELYKAGVDALIVQDMALLEMDIPPVELHASTQCDIRTPEKAKFLEDVGFEQLVLPREMSLREIRKVREVTTVPLECFVHGALCVSYSGDCRASFVNGGRSANRGECAQICRLPYNLVDGSGKVIMENKHLLSLKDMNRIDSLADMIKSGVTSFKIEGRLKSEDYVRNITFAYSQALNRFIGTQKDGFERTSYGHIVTDFIPDVTKTFNRQFIPYFLKNESPAKGELSTFLTPKHIGQPVGYVLKSTPRKLIVKLNVTVVNGDGLGFFDKQGRFIGFRVNRIEDGTIYLATNIEICPPKGTTLYRNYDKAFCDSLDKSSFKRYINVDCELRSTLHGISLTLHDERGCRITKTLDCEVVKARSSQIVGRRRIIEKAGNTVYKVINVTDTVGDDIFIPASQLTTLRREAFETLDKVGAATYPLNIRKPYDRNKAVLPNRHLDMHDNVANTLARKFYERAGAIIQESAVETAPLSVAEGEIEVMNTRYCLRRELGACLKTPDGVKIKGPLKLVSTDRKMRPMILNFDCKNCRMHIIAEKKDAQN